MVQGEEPPLAVSEALFTALGYYFATRARVGLSKRELEQRREEFGEQAELRPLFLPRGAIRILITLSFAAVAAYLVHRRGWGELAASTTLLLVFAFFAGQAVKYLVLWLRPPGERRKIGAFEHGKAGVGLLVAAAFVVMYVGGYHKSADPRAHKLFLGFIIFYFGSR
jgi:hypothetical protein